MFYKKGRAVAIALTVAPIVAVAVGNAGALARPERVDITVPLCLAFPVLRGVGYRLIISIRVGGRNATLKSKLTSRT